MPPEIFTDDFLSTVESLIRRHHTIYPLLPPQGLFFEAIVEQGFRLAGWSSEQVVPTTPNSPWHDLAIGGIRLSIKSETGKSTKPGRISITKLCTTEKGDWNAPALDVSFHLAHIKLTNLSPENFAYETKAPTGDWGETLTLKPGDSHEFELPYPLTYRHGGSSGSEFYTLPVGSHSEFRVPLTGGSPKLFAAKKP